MSINFYQGSSVPITEKYMVQIPFQIRTGYCFDYLNVLE
jgi:hypothetical protein